MRNSEKPMSKLLCLCNGINSHNLDRISEFPDGIRENILSNLTFKEAVSTCVLSHRWTTCWKFSKVLNFDASDVLLQIKRFPRTLKFDQPGAWRQLHDFLAAKQCWYTDIANRGLSFINTPSMESVRFCFDLTNCFGDHIGGWIKSALDKKTRCLQLNLTPAFPISFKNQFHLYEPCEAYVFTMDRLNHTNIKLLTFITLKYVQVSDEVFHYLLSNCPVLQSLCIERSKLLTNLSVAGPSLALKHLKISACFSLKTIHISAPALSSFKFYGGETIIDIKSAPLLTKLGIGDHYYDIYEQLLRCSRYFSGLKSLTLKFDFWDAWDAWEYNGTSYGAIPELTNLTHLEIHGMPEDNFSLLPYMYFMEKCPALSSFKMKKISMKHSSSLEREIHSNATKAKVSLKYMRVVEFSGFIGSTTDLEIVMFLLDLSVTLDKLIIRIAQPIDNFLIIPSDEDLTEADRELARDRALRIVVPPGTQLVLP